MLESDLLLNAVAAGLLAVLAWRMPAVRRLAERSGLALVIGGALLPLLDPALAYLRTADRIALLSQRPLLQGLAPALVLIGVAAVAAYALGYPRRAAQVLLWATLGYALHALLALLTPVGWPLLAPFSEMRFSLPLLPAGHLPLLALLLVALAVLQSLPARRDWIVFGTAGLAAVYLLAGAVQYGIVRVRTASLAPPDGAVHVYPDGAWSARWQVVVETPEHYELRRLTAFAEDTGTPKVMARWNDQPLFLKLLGDPVVNWYYFMVFQHPVVRLDISGAQITLLMQELEDQSPLVPGPTFYLESDLTGRNRFYQLQRFN